MRDAETQRWLQVNPLSLFLVLVVGVMEYSLRLGLDTGQSGARLIRLLCKLVDGETPSLTYRDEGPDTCHQTTLEDTLVLLDAAIKDAGLDRVSFTKLYTAILRQVSSFGA